ncbi:60S ribosomal subunit assembly/export protein [Lepraria neglecta]|uniref:60S ribosomal subunit assembly/export protein n=1 Tax=Lepraria neglecta TaxID=209136 RepID=A0AAD9Z2T9_9LECA|nr:60S ribosomal subunit assembly/export protein [Lepraria neglecta]
MAPTRTAKTSAKGAKGSTKSNVLGAKAKGRISKKAKAPPPKLQKTKSATAPTKKKKKRVYTEKELGIPKLNMITPMGVDLPKGKKKGKIL